MVCPRCGSEHIDVEKDTYNDLVKMLHSVGQIVPRAGDYVAIYDEPMGMFGVPGLITQITRYPDKPVDNKIELNTSYTDDEELVGNIITATNTVLNNADIYARTAVLKADGTLDENSIRESLDNSNANITIVGTNGNILLDGSGLRATDPMDPHSAMKYAGNGIFNTTNLDNAAGEAVVWEKMMGPGGINATYINSGTIDTNKLTIMSGLSGKVILDQYGLSVKQNAAKANHITEFNPSTARTNANYTKQWGIDNNLKTFVGVDTNNNGLIYTSGFLVAEEGSNIANWITDNNGFYHLNGSNQKDLWLSPNGISGTVLNSTQNYALYANGNFGVTTGGTLLANGANISGKIVVTDSSSTVNTGSVGGWVSTDKGLKNSASSTSLVLSPAGGAITGTVHSSGSRSDWGIFMNSKFGVTTSGDLYASNATISGNITATTLTATQSGQIGPWIFNSEAIYNGKGIGEAGSTGLSNYTDWAFWANNGAFRVAQNGYLYANNADIQGKITSSSGKIGGWTINQNSLSGGSLYTGNWEINSSHIKSTSSGERTTINEDGSAYFYPAAGYGGGWLKVHGKVDINGPEGIVIDTGTGESNPGNGVMHLKAESKLGLYSNGNINIGCGSSYNIALEGGGLRIRSGAVSVDGNNAVGDVTITISPTIKLHFLKGILVASGSTIPGM